MYITPIIAPTKFEHKSRAVLMYPPTQLSGTDWSTINSITSLSAPKPHPAIIKTIPTAHHI